MNAVDLFATLLAQGSNVRKSEYSALPAYGHLIKADLVKDAGVVSSTFCSECDYPHDAEIVFKNNGYGYYCPAFGFIPIPRSDLIATRPNILAFITQIADQLNCKRRKSTALHGDIWRIGAINTPAGDVALYLSPNMQKSDDVRDVQSVLIGEVKFAYGIIFTATGGLSVPPYVTVQLQDILSVDPNTGKLTVTANLETIAGVPQQRGGGRPNDYKEPLTKLAAIRASQGRTLIGRNEEAKALQAEYTAQFPNKKTPSIQTVKKFVTTLRSGS